VYFHTKLLKDFCYLVEYHQKKYFAAMALKRLRILLVAAIVMVSALIMLAAQNLWWVHKLPAVLSALAGLSVAVFLLFGILKKRTVLYYLPIGAVSIFVLLLEILIRISLYFDFAVLPTHFLQPVFPSNQFQVPLFDRPAARADSIIGYRWSTDSVRVLKVGGNRIEYVNSFSGNNAGFHSEKPYRFLKSDSTYRILVLGDSFTDAHFLARPWAQTWEQLLKQKGVRAEVYSFGINGGGMVNWHRLYFKELLPYYEFDAVVLAVFGNDLDREFFSMHHDSNKVYLKYFETLPEPNFQEALMQTKGLQNVITAAQWDRIFHLYHSDVQWYRADFFALQAMINAGTNWRDKLHQQIEPPHFISRYILPAASELNESSLQEKYGANLSLLEELVRSCQNAGKAVYFFCIPEKEGALLSMEGRTPQIAAELEYLAKKFGVPYWNGYLPYRRSKREEIFTHFMNPDGHWNQTGSDFFSKRIPDYFFGNGSAAH
jgi:hypothetical protein